MDYVRVRLLPKNRINIGRVFCRTPGVAELLVKQGRAEYVDTPAKSDDRPDVSSGHDSPVQAATENTSKRKRSRRRVDTDAGHGDNDD